MTRPKLTHLVVLIHGLYGSPNNLTVLKEELERAHANLSANGGATSSNSPSDGIAASEDGLKGAVDGNENEGRDGIAGSNSKSTLTSTSSCGPGLSSNAGYATTTANEDDDNDHAPLLSVPPDNSDEFSNPIEQTRETRMGGSEPEPPAENGADLELDILVPKSFCGSHTWDGIDVNAQRAARELDERIEKLEDEGKKIVCVSIMGYSLGGLIARYLIGMLDSRSPNFFDRYPPGCFSTAATPHLGVLKYGSTTNTIVHTVGRRLFSRTGQQLYCLDKEWNGRCLLEILSDPNFVFLKGLRRFKRIVIVANGYRSRCFDLTVPYPSAAISLTDPFADYPHNGTQLQVDNENIISSWSLSSDAAQESSTASDLAEKVIPTVQVKEKGGMVRPRMPPIFFLLPWPFNYVLVVVFPLLIPFILLFVTITMVYQSWKSAARTRLHHTSHEHVPLLTEPIAILASPPSLVPELASHSRISFLSAPSSQPSSSPASRSSTPPLYESVDGAETDASEKQSVIPLLLTSAQKVMVQNMNEHLPQMERLIGWFPWAFNSHATLIVRDVKQFKFQEEGRGVVKRWARYVAETPEGV